MASEYGTREWWDEHRAGAYGGFKGGYSSADDPYRGVQPWEIRREESARERAAENARISEKRRRDAMEEQTRLRNMTPEDRREYIENKEKQRRREEFLSGMTPEQRSRYYQNEREHNEFLRSLEAQNKQKQEREAKLTAFKQAKERYKRLNAFTKLKLKLAGKAPNNINPNSMNVNEIERLYRR